MSDGEKEGIRSISSALGKTNMGRREETKTAQGRRLNEESGRGMIVHVFSLWL